MPPKKRDRPRVKGSWRDKNKGDCFTTKGGQVVCEGSKGMNYQSQDKRRRRKNLGNKVVKEVKKKEAVKKIQGAVRGKLSRGKEVEFDDLTIRSGSKTAPNKTGGGELYLEVVKPFGNTTIAKKKGLYKIKDIPSKKGTGSQNTQKFNVYKKGKDGEEVQFNPYTAKGNKAIEDGSVRFVRKKI
jgi:hypothetical protein